MNTEVQNCLLDFRIEQARKLADKVADAIIDAEQRASDALAQAKKTHDEVALDVKNEYAKENAALKEQLRFCVASLSSVKELEAYDKFAKDHEKCRLSSRANCGKMPYVIQTGTGIGTSTEVICQVCGASEDITDISVW